VRNLLLKCLPGLLCFLIPAANVMAQGGDRVPLDIQQYFQSQKFKEPTYKDTVAKDRLAIIKPISEPNSNVTLLVDTKGGKNIFPIARKPRRFKSESELQEFMAKRINGDIETAQVGVNGVYRQEGAAYFYDPNPGITYRITDPILV
jgi:hypothetical protein